MSNESFKVKVDIDISEESMIELQKKIQGVFDNTELNLKLKFNDKKETKG